LKLKVLECNEDANRRFESFLFSNTSFYSLFIYESLFNSLCDCLSASVSSLSPFFLSLLLLSLPLCPSLSQYILYFSFRFPLSLSSSRFPLSLSLSSISSLCLCLYSLAPLTVSLSLSYSLSVSLSLSLSLGMPLFLCLCLCLSI
jgi:hypothetical protein